MPWLTRGWWAVPLALALSVAMVRRAGPALLPAGSPSERLLAGLTVHLAWTVLGVRVLAGLGVLGCAAMLAWLGIGALAAFLFARGAGGTQSERWSTPSTIPLVLVFAVAMALLVAAVVLLPVWHWDGLGYHLPLVNYLLERGRLDDVPPDVPFLSTYPRNVEYFFAAVRALLHDDTLVDAAQLPFALLAVTAIANITVSLGGRLAHGVAAGMAFCLLPAAYLILPTNYIDFACAALLLAAMAWSLKPATRVHLAMVAVCLGLFLGAKSNGPIGTGLVASVVVVRWARAKPRGARLGPLLALSACVLLLGAEMYVVNAIRHHNPLWPIDLHVGPWRLPGTVTVEKLLAAGARAPRVHGSLPIRVLKSWTALRAPPMFDMRFGGLGLVFVLALAASAHVLWKKRGSGELLLTLGVFFLAAVASPDPAWPRYVLAVPGLALAIAASALATASLRVERAVVWGIAALSSGNVIQAAPALHGDGPPLSAYPSMSTAERARAVWAESPVDGWFAARDALSPGQNAAYDFSMELPYLLWKNDIGNRVFRLPDHATASELEDIFRNQNVHLLVAGDDEPAGALVRSQPDRFTFLFRCPLRPCAVYRL